MNLSDNGNNKTSPKLGAVAIATVLVVLAILLIVIIPNLEKKGSKPVNTPSQNNTPSDVILAEPEQNGSLVNSPNELDFWELYPENKPDEITQDSSNSENTAKPEIDVKPEVEDPSTDGKHTKIINRDGTEEWVLISQYLPKHDYDYTNLVSKNDRMEYYVDGKKASYLGIDVSKYQDYIDFVKVKKDGANFVMIRLGARGYGTGQITIDDYFYDNIKRATDVGLNVGIYFSSQAITVEEAEEEAQVVIDAIGEYKVTYPIVFDMEYVINDTARVEALSVADRTTVTKAFLDKISASGHTGMIYGDKEWLIKEIDMSKLTAYDVWLTQTGDLPDYPYKFSMWQYKKNGTVDGVSGFVGLNISFVDYTEK